jgi:hypothetical protein
MPGTSTFGDVTTAADVRKISFSVMDASGDTFPEMIYVALTATYTAIQAWLALYQAVTNTSIFDVEDIRGWSGDADPDNAVAAFRSGKDQGINLLFKNADTRDTIPLRVVGPVADVMQGNQDIPLLTGGSMDELIVATIGLQPTYNFASAQFTVHRERKGNPKVK